MQSLAQIREILESRGLTPHKRLGQNFLIDQNLGRKLVDASNAISGDLVLEIGPGTGTLSEEILARGCGLIACEMDRGLCEHLRDHFRDETRFSLIEGDCLTRSRTLAPAVRDAIDDRPFRLIANLPYGTASPVLSTLLLDHPNCLGMYITIQREVADKLNASPGTKAYGPMAILAWASADVKRIATLAPSCFWPRPEVTSAMISLTQLEKPRVADLAGFSEFLRRAFQNRRKQLGSVLSLECWPEDVEPRSRAESLTPEQIIKVWRCESEIEKG